ncbi:hypothetical protein [Niastella sp. OAS944]|uniref:hypothetical protein n=1 Tax=Niastella sp. OAS944 TaxID=2664089 RepID=UPI00346D9C9C|nr:hypothetical protein [Chitinophagaceae bacterium OAS944]
MKKVIILIIIVVVLSNLPPLKWIVGPDDILYSNASGSFTFNELNYAGRNYQLCIVNFEAFKSVHKEDTLLFRITPINIFKFWRWNEYLTNDKYKLHYKSWKEIETKRGPLVNKTNWQAF